MLVTARNTADYLLTWFALMEVGAIQVPINPQSTPAELEGFVHQVAPSVVTDAMAPTPMSHRLGSSAAPDRRGPANVDPSDVAVMIPTSGTTGRSKLVMQTHLAYVMAGEGFPYWMQLTSDDRLMTSLPLFHINAPAYSTLGSVAGAREPRAAPGASPRARFLDAARRFGATEFNAIGAMLEILMRQPPRADDADNPLRLCYTGPSPERERHARDRARFGLEIVCGYALSESPVRADLAARRAALRHAGLGAPAPGARSRQRRGSSVTTVVVLGRRRGRRARAAQPGDHARLLRDARGDRGRDASTVGCAPATSCTANDDETFTFLGRKKEVIRRRGENLSPAEVEAALERHPDVAEAAVIGVPSGPLRGRREGVRGRGARRVRRRHHGARARP